MSKSYIIIPEDTINYEDNTLVRIKNKAGILGGYIQQYKLTNRVVNNLNENGGWIDSGIKVIGINGKGYVNADSKIKGKGILKDTLVMHSTIELQDIVLENCLVHNVYGKLNLPENTVLKHKLIICRNNNICVEEGDW